MKIRLIAQIALIVTVLAALNSCSSAASTEETDPASIVKAFFDAENADNLDAAMALVSDDAVFSYPNYGPYEGKDEIRKWEEVGMQYGGEIELSNIQVASDTVTFTAKFLWIGSHVEHDFEVIVEGGKIKSLTAR